MCSPGDSYVGDGIHKHSWSCHILSLQLSYWKVETIPDPAEVLSLPSLFHLCQPHTASVNHLRIRAALVL